MRVRESMGNYEGRDAESECPAARGAKSDLRNGPSGPLVPIAKEPEIGDSGQFEEGRSQRSK
jgi:hypothetical protein